MKSLLRKVFWRILAWVPVRDSGRVDHSLAAMSRVLDLMEESEQDLVYRGELLRTLLAGRGDTAALTGPPAGPAGAAVPSPARLDVVASQWALAVETHTVTSDTRGVYADLLGFSRELALHVLAPSDTGVSAADIGARHANAHRPTVESFSRGVAVVAGFLQELSRSAPEAAQGAWTRVVGDFVAGFTGAAQVRVMVEQEQVFCALAGASTGIRQRGVSCAGEGFRESATAMAVVDGSGTLVEVNATLGALLGTEPGLLAGRDLRVLARPGEDCLVVDRLRHRLSDAEPGYGKDFRLNNPNGEAPVWVRPHWAPSATHPGRVHITLHNTTYYHLHHDWHRGRTQHDEVTNLPTRSRLLERLTQLLADADAVPAVGLYGVRLVGLTAINETIGLSTADEVLAALAARVAKSAPASADMVAHLDRDTLVVLIADQASWAQADGMVRRIGDWLDHPVRVRDGCELSVRPVVAAVRGEPGRDAHSLVRRLELGLRHHTPATRPAVITTDSDRRRNGEVTRLATALENDEFTLLHAPVVRVSTGRVAGAHATLAGREPDRWQTPLAELVALADSIGLALPVGPWLVRAAVRQAADWAGELGAAAPFVRVDIPDRFAADEAIVYHVRAALADTGLPGHLLHIGLTEAGLLDVDGQPHAHLLRLAALRVHLVLTGLGTGLRRLDLLPEAVVQGVATAPELTAGGHDPIPRQGVKSILQVLAELAGQLGLAVTVGDVHTERDRRLARRVGATFLLGDALGPPGPAAALLDRVRREHRSHRPPR